MKCLFILALLHSPSLKAEDPFQSAVRPTSALSPAEEQQTFHLPEGFEIQLFAAEPDIQKPMNLAFDASGRLWVSGSVEYPNAAKEGEGRDAIKVLEDTNGDGRADKIVTFADGLNIPIGLYPYRGGVIAYSIPNVYFFRDTDGDGKADDRQILFESLSPPKDTHGMLNAFRRGFDGWLYINHGFSNNTTLKGSNGSSLTLHSGNTFRIKLDGSALEQFTWGQVNPFGSAFTAIGDLINADCHSKPLTMLIRQSYYSSFGKAHDGLGHAPNIMNHGHGSSAIAGVAIVPGAGFPQEYQGSVLVGNVMSSRVHRDSLAYDGATPKAVKEKDFLTSDDPWFRPVDLQFGPDGALYIADFYNKIIGHYEVALDHPGRDRTSGRIWRVTYVGKENEKNEPVTTHPNLAKADPKELISTLSHPNLRVRMLATDQLTDRIGEKSVEPLRKAFGLAKNSFEKIHSLWALHRLKGVELEQLDSATRDYNSQVRIHAMRVLAESSNWSDSHRELAISGLNDPDAKVQRAAGEALGLHADYSVIRELMHVLHRTPDTDVFLKHTLRIALRNQIRPKGTLSRLGAFVLKDADRQALSDIALAVNSEEAADFLIDTIRMKGIAGKNSKKHLEHAVRFISEKRIAGLVTLMREDPAVELNHQLVIIEILRKHLKKRGIDADASLSPWAGDIAREILDSVEHPDSSWPNLASPWGLELRKSSDGSDKVGFLSSLPGGESKTAKLRSHTFVVPEKLQFFICGHLGPPDKPAIKKNFITLRLAATDELVAQAMPPRNDTAVAVEWQLQKFAGKKAYIELVDGVAVPSFAWLAVSRFKPPVVSVPLSNPQERRNRIKTALKLVEDFKIAALSTLVRSILLKSNDLDLKAAAAHALIYLEQKPGLYVLADLIMEDSLRADLRDEIVQSIAQPKDRDVEKLLAASMQAATTRLQQSAAQKLAGTRHGGEMLLKLVEQSSASPILLQDSNIRQKLLAAKVVKADERIKQLVEGLPPQDEEVQKLIEQRVSGFALSKPSTQNGREVFMKHCSICHQLNGEGALLGPQLDGINSRGTARIMEDILDPNRNIDRAFLTTVVATNDGTISDGLFRQEDAKSLVIADREGNEITIPKDEILERKTSRNSLMPAGLGNVLKEQELYDLVHFLISSKEQSAMSKKEQRIAFLGDSITDGNTYPALYRQALTAAGKPEPICINTAIAGDTAAGMLKRLERDVLVHEPTLMTLSVGINDVLRNVSQEDYERDVTAIANRMKAEQVPLLILTTSVLGPKHADANKRLDGYNSFLRKLAEMNGYAVADVNALMRKAVSDGGSVLEEDEVHPNWPGHRVMARAVLDAIGHKDVKLPDKLKLVMMPGVIQQWRIQIAPEKEALTEKIVNDLTPDDSWKAYTLPETEKIDNWWLDDERRRGFALSLEKSVGKGQAYQGHAVIDSAAARKVYFNTGAQLQTIWLNGKRIYKSEGWTGWHAGKERVPAELEKGRNTILIETQSQFFLSVTDGRRW